MKNYSKRLKFRPLELNDIHWLMDWENDPENWASSDRQLPFSKEIFIQYLQNAQESLHDAGQFRWVIESLDTLEPIGLLDLFEHSEKHQRAEVGVLIHKAYRQHGYAQESLRWLMEYSREIALLNQLFAQVDQTNGISIQLFNAVGFQQCGLLKNWNRRKDGFVDVVQFQYFL